MKKNLLPLLLVLGICIQSFAQVFSEDFTNGIPADWVQYTETGIDFIDAFNGEARLFKQSAGAEIMLLATPQLDLSLYTRAEIPMMAFNLSFFSDTKPFAHIGILTDPNDVSTFEVIHVIHVEEESFVLHEVLLGGYNGMGHVAIKMVGEKSQIMHIDYIYLYDDPINSSQPLAVTDLTIAAAPMGALEAEASWTNPAFEADGDALTSLDSVVFYYPDGSTAYTHLNPVIGAMESAMIPIDSPDYYQYEVVAYSDGEKGYSAFTDIEWIGLDFPAAVKDLQITLTGDQVEITWTPPTVGSNGGYFDGVVTGYNITRADGAFYAVPGNITSFSETLDKFGSFDYIVTAENTSGAGDPGTTTPIHYDGPDYLYYEDFYVDVVDAYFETPSNIDFFWTTEYTTTNAFWTWFGSDFSTTGAGEMAMTWSSQNTGLTDTIRTISPIINTSGLTAITVQYYQYVEVGNQSPGSFFLETTSDGGNTWQSVQEWPVNSNISEHITKTIANADVGSADFQIAITFVGNPFYLGFVRYDDFRVFYQPTTDVSVFDFALPNTEEPGNSISLIADIENKSTSMVDCQAKVVVKERFSTNTLLETIVDETNMAVGEVRTVDFGMWTAVEGEYVVEVIVINSSDQVPENDTMSQNLNVFQLNPRDVVIIEDFTGTWCTYCPGAALGIEDLHAAGYDIAAIGYHRNDPYETPEVQNRMDFYEVVGFPTLLFDGIVKNSGGHATLSMFPVYEPIAIERAATGSPVILTPLHSVLTDKEYLAYVNVSSNTAMKNPYLKLIAVVTESDIDEMWKGLDKLHDVERHYAEYSIDLSDNEETVEVKFTISDDIDISNADVVFFVQESDSREIYNGTNLHLTDILFNTDEADFGAKVDVFPNPFLNHITVELNDATVGKDITIRLIDALGREVYRMQEGIYAEHQFIYIQNITMASGMYFMELQSEDKTLVRKVSKF